MSKTISIVHSFSFEAAHLLPRVPEDHKCRRLHGHSFMVDLSVSGEMDPELEWLIDYGEIKKVVEPIRQSLDHHYLNEIEGLENPTSENVAIWIWDRLISSLPQLVEVCVRETCNNACRYRGL